MKRYKTYFKVWYLNSSNALQQTFVNRYTNILFFIGKILRFAASLLVLILIKQNINTFATYTSDEMIVFFLTYHFIDTITQVFFRGTYHISNEVRTGEFDFTLTKPINPLFQALTGKPDFNDAIFIFPSTLVSIILISQLNLNITLESTLWYLALLMNGFLISMGLHILIMSVGIITTEIDGAVWIYRDMMQLGRFPVDIYLAPLRFALYFLIPVGLIITIPSQYLLQTDKSFSAMFSFVVGISFLYLCTKIWNYALRKYSSASS